MHGCRGRIFKNKVGLWEIRCEHGRDFETSWSRAMRHFWNHLHNQFFWYLDDVGYPYQKGSRYAAIDRVNEMFPE